MARQVSSAMLLEMNRTAPSHSTTCTPPGWRLRAAMFCGFADVGPTQGGLGCRLMQYCSCSTTSGWLEFGWRCASKWDPLLHQAKPRRSWPPGCPLIVSEKARVLLVPSTISAIRMACGTVLELLTWMNGAPPKRLGCPLLAVPNVARRPNVVLP